MAYFATFLAAHKLSADDEEGGQIPSCVVASFVELFVKARKRQCNVVDRGVLADLICSP
jgi:hypothetical protein